MVYLTLFQKSYLLQSRDRRISYRRIAASLGKTELACRLHYHQLTVVKPRQTEEAYTPLVHPRGTPASVASPWTPETTHTHNLVESPSMEQLTLPSLSKWFEQCGHHRSISLPTRLAAQSSGSQYGQDMRTPYVQLAPPTPPTPNMPSSFTLLHAGLGVIPVHGHNRASSYSSARVTSPRLFAPTPMLSPDVSWGWRPRATRCSSISSNGSWGGLSPPHSHTSPISTNTSLASSDRCSVHSLLNHEDG